ncbi:hypothetical protein HRbin03_00430 [archaeon HR03]|nr:hypothetical protein HRbin03_00430 [archaeon HR03]
MVAVAGWVEEFRVLRCCFCLGCGCDELGDGGEPSSRACFREHYLCLGELDWGCSGVARHRIQAGRCARRPEAERQHARCHSVHRRAAHLRHPLLLTSGPRSSCSSQSRRKNRATHSNHFPPRTSDNSHGNGFTIRCQASCPDTWEGGCLGRRHLLALDGGQHSGHFLNSFRASPQPRRQNSCTGQRSSPHDNGGTLSLQDGEDIHGSASAHRVDACGLLCTGLDCFRWRGSLQP